VDGTEDTTAKYLFQLRFVLNNSMRYIYKITSPSQKIYIGQSVVPEARKKSFYRYLEKSSNTDRKIINAIKKYGWVNMTFEIIDRNDTWTQEQLNEREIHWIKLLNSTTEGYNILKGGGGRDSEEARYYTTKYHASMTEEQRKERSKNCSNGQKARFKQNPESQETKNRKSTAHKQSYRIESPEGKIWLTTDGLKDFAEKYKEEIGISYWSLFNAYRNGYSGTIATHNRKNVNRWKVEKLDESNIRHNSC
jgi:hypothetical protein